MLYSASIRGGTPHGLLSSCLLTSKLSHTTFVFLYMSSPQQLHNHGWPTVKNQFPIIGAWLPHPHIYRHNNYHWTFLESGLKSKVRAVSQRSYSLYVGRGILPITQAHDISSLPGAAAGGYCWGELGAMGQWGGGWGWWWWARWPVFLILSPPAPSI